MEQEELIIDDVKFETEESDEDVEVIVSNELSVQSTEEGNCKATQTVTEVSSDVEPEKFIDSKDEAECSAMPEKRRRNYNIFCSVFGCRSVRSLADPPELRLTMFTLPTDVERRIQWLRLIDREHLITSPSSHHCVCESHFYQGSIIPTSSRKLLKKNAIPILNLPDSSGRVSTAHVQTQTAPPNVISQQSQTTVDLPHHLPLVQKLKQEIRQLKKERRTVTSKKQELKLLHELCDKHMSEKFAALARVHLLNKERTCGRRYGAEYKQFCYRIYEASPKAYDILKEVLPLPNSRHMTMKMNTLGESSLSNVEDGRMDTVASSDDEPDDVAAPVSGTAAPTPATTEPAAQLLLHQETQTQPTSAYVQLMTEPMPDLHFHIDKPYT